MRLPPLSLLAVLVVTCLAALTCRAGDPPRVYAATPPDDIRELIARVKTRDGPTPATKALAARDDAAPYLRAELAGTADRVAQRDLTEALEVIEERAYRRNLGRAKAWVAGRRFDLYAEFLSGCRNADALVLAELIYPIRRGILDEADRVLAYTSRPRFGDPARHLWRTHLAGESLTVGERVYPNQMLVRARDCTMEVWEKDNSLVAVRGEFRDPLKQRSGGLGLWFYSIALINGQMPLGVCTNTLVVCDGDIELFAGIDASVVIANGDIRLADAKAPGVSGRSLRHAVLCATGNITSPDLNPEASYFHAGGMVTFAEKQPASERVREKQKELPFGVRFLDPAEFGLTLAAQNGGVQVVGLRSDSPFARFGVEDGDIITSIDDVKADTIPAFRRALRAGVLRESVVLRITRAGKPITRIIFLDGVPDFSRTAPPPREVKR